MSVVRSRVSPVGKRPPDEGRAIQLVYYAYVVLSAVARALPERFVYSTARSVGRLGSKRSKKRGQVARNLSIITGEPEDSPRVQQLVVKSFESYARYWLETFRLVREGPDFFLERFRSSTQNKLFEDMMRDGKGALVVVGHLGNWDAAGAWVGANGHRLVTVAEVLKPRRMFEFFADHRASLGMTIFPAEKGATTRLAEAAQGGAIVAILGDRDLKGTGPEVTFFGRPANFPAGPASIALATRLPLCVAPVYSVIRDDGTRGWDAEIGDVIPLPEEGAPDPIQELTQRIALELERGIAKRPEEWHVFGPFWQEDRAAARRKAGR